MKTIRYIALLPVLLMSCASDKKTAEAPAHQSMNERFSSGGRDPNSVTLDSSGKVVRNGKRSPFESQGESNYANKDFTKQAYKTGDYTKKSWWGNKDYGSKTYAGNTDGSRFQTKSKLQDKGAREAGTNARIPDAYQTGDYATAAAHEAGATAIKKGSNDQIENTQETFQQPEIIDWREQRSLSRDQSKGILGH